MDEGKEHPLAAQYRDRGIPTDWKDITPEAFEPVFKLWYRGLPSPDRKSGFFPGQDEAEELIHDPAKALGTANLVGGEVLPRISTMVVNHEKTLNRFIMHAFVAISKNPSTIGLTIVKEEWAGEEGTEEPDEQPGP